MVTRPPFGGWVPGNRWDLLDGVHPDPLPTVSVVIAHFEQPRELARTLRALDRQTYPGALVEVIVADDGSALEPAVGPGVRLVRQEDRGFRLSAVRNLGVQEASGDILCFLDADTAPEPDYLRRLTRLPALLPETVTVGRRRHADLADVPIDVPVEEVAPSRALEDPAWLADAYRWSRDLRDADERSYRHVIGATLACTRWLFDEVGGFDETFTDYGGEDWEWVHRAYSAGALLAHEPTAIVWHDGPDWAGRDDTAAAERHNDEVLRMTTRIPVAGSRGHAVRARVPDVVVRLHDPADGEATDAATFVCVDTVLSALPHARVLLDEGRSLALFASDPRVGIARPEDASPHRARVHLDLPRPVAFHGEAAAGELSTAIGLLSSAEHGDLRLRDRNGTLVGWAVSGRAAQRRARWGVDEVVAIEDVRLEGATVLRAQPDVEAYLGGWAAERHLR
ncbi:glycosyltransferase [Microbacterium sp. P02]|uniref:glycosyltransferase n=1 Tax=Microbacterium sp. P02 TaxID=3366260 RepID=UPI00367335A0